MTGEQIRKLRLIEGREWSQKQLADFLGVKQATVSRLENGEWKPSKPILKLLEQFAEQRASEAA